jgi:hypothetical protein
LIFQFPTTERRKLVQPIITEKFVIFSSWALREKNWHSTCSLNCLESKEFFFQFQMHLGFAISTDGDMEILIEFSNAEKNY